MDKQQRDVTELELTLEDLNEVNGGVRNNQTEAWAAFAGGSLKVLLRLVATRPASSVSDHKKRPPQLAASFI
ncbi:hypothetical protein [Bradyrhizobium sp. RDM4]|uniref:hypothetical protein n=1 Tax=Bradyrhizobium sp. RDM4 TaxID=3378765 RepID=UPI0038FCF9D1